MVTRYVRKTGNDTTGNGSTENPYLTISKVLPDMANGGDVYIGAGVYEESTSGSGYFNFARNYASEVIFQSETGNAADVVITGASHATYDTMIGTISNNATFRNLTFKQRVDSTQTAVRISGGTALRFENCVFGPATAASTKYGVYLNVSASGTVNGVTFEGCTFNETAGYAIGVAGRVDGVTANIAIRNCTALLCGNYALYFNGYTTDITVNGGTFASSGANCLHSNNVTTLSVTGGSYTATGSGKIALNVVGASAANITDAVATASSAQALYTESCTSVTVVGGTFTSSAANKPAVHLHANGTARDLVSLTNVSTVGSYQGCWIRGPINDLVISGGSFSSTDYPALQVGEDGVGAGDILSGEIHDAMVSSVNSHSLLIGGGCVNLVASNLRVYGGDYGVVVKENSGTSITNSVMVSGTYAACYCKASTGTTIQRNLILAAQGFCFKVGVNLVTSNKCQNITLSYNKLLATGSGACLNWGGAADDAGGGVCDYNTYQYRGTGNYGTFYGTENCATLPAIRTAWAEYGDGTNDGHSKKKYVPIVATV